MRPGFALTPENAGAVAEVCRRLDGLPLAIELAAARIGSCAPHQLAARLRDRFDLLSGGRTALPRHRTLRAAIDWSFDLLSEPERVLFSRLSVFAGHWTLEAAVAVCADPPSGGAGRRAPGWPRLRCSTSWPDLVDLSLVQAVPADEAGAEAGGAAQELPGRCGDPLRDAGDAARLRPPASAGAGRGRGRRPAGRHVLHPPGRTALPAVGAVGGRAARLAWLPSREEAWFASIEAEQANVRAALAWAVRRR